MLSYIHFISAFLGFHTDISKMLKDELALWFITGHNVVSDVVVLQNVYK